tara:strand:- start:361 stop:597 length:237 start_codon:yes stop_codon:yes gene_type:complete
MDGFIYYVGVLCLAALSVFTALYFFESLKWAYIDTRRASRHIKKGASKIAVTKVLIIIFWSEFTEGLVRGVIGVKRTE